MITPLLVLAAMVVLNSSADIRVPLSVTVGSSPNGAAVQQAAQPLFDATTLAALAGLASSLFYRWKKSDKHEELFNNRTTTSAQTVAQQADSLKATDKGIEELIGNLGAVVNMIPGVPQQAKDLITTQLQAWQRDNQAYYENKPAKPTDLSPDPVIKKLGEIQKTSEKNET